MESFATPYPVFFQDDSGEPQPMGIIGVHSVLTFKRFISLMAQKINLPVGSFSAVFVCRRMVGDVDKRQKLPVNENTNFNILLNQHNPSKERDAHFLISVKKSKKDRKGGVGGKKKTDADDEDDESVEAESGSSPPGPSAALAAAAQREAAQRERERLNLALGRAPSTPAVAADARAGGVVKAVASSAAAGAGARPPQPAVPPPQVLGASFSAASSRALPTPLAGAPALSRLVVPPPAPGKPAAPPPPPAVQPQPRPPAPPAQPAPPARAFAPFAQQLQGGRADSGGEGGAEDSGGGLHEAAAALPAPPRLAPATAAGAPHPPQQPCKFCLFCRERGHEPPFHWCSEDRVLLPQLRAPTPWGAIAPARRGLASGA